MSLKIGLKKSKAFLVIWGNSPKNMGKTSNFPAGMGFQLCFVGQIQTLWAAFLCTCLFWNSRTTLRIDIASKSKFVSLLFKKKWMEQAFCSPVLLNCLQQQLGWFTHPMVVQCLIFWFGVFLIPLTLPHGSRKHRCWFFFITNQFRLL